MKPTAIPFFDDPRSLGHTAAGIAMRVLPGPAAAAVGLLFLVYQMQEGRADGGQARRLWGAGGRVLDGGGAGCIMNSMQPCRPWQKSEVDTSQQNVCNTTFASVYSMPHNFIGMQCDGWNWTCFWVDGAAWLGLGVLLYSLGSKR